MVVTVSWVASTVAAAKPWHYWVGVALTIGSVLTVLTLGLAYVYRCVRPNYPPSPRDAAPTPRLEPPTDDPEEHVHKPIGRVALALVIAAVVVGAVIALVEIDATGTWLKDNKDAIGSLGSVAAALALVGAVTAVFVSLRQLHVQQQTSRGLAAYSASKDFRDMMTKANGQEPTLGNLLTSWAGIHTLYKYGVIGKTEWSEAFDDMRNELAEPENRKTWEDKKDGPYTFNQAFRKEVERAIKEPPTSAGTGGTDAVQR